MAEGAPALREALTAAVAVRTRGRDLVSCRPRRSRLDRRRLPGRAQRDARRGLHGGERRPVADDVAWARRTVEQLDNVEHHVVPADEMPLVYHGLLHRGRRARRTVRRGRRPRPVPGVWSVGPATRGSRLHLTGFGGDELLYGSVAHLHEVLRTSPRTGAAPPARVRAKYRWSRREMLRQLDGPPPLRHVAGRASAALLTETRPPIDEPLLGWGFTPRLPPGPRRPASARSAT